MKPTFNPISFVFLALFWVAGNWTLSLIGFVKTIQAHQCADCSDPNLSEHMGVPKVPPSFHTPQMKRESGSSEEKQDLPQI